MFQNPGETSGSLERHLASLKVKWKVFFLSWILTEGLSAEAGRSIVRQNQSTWMPHQTEICVLRLHTQKGSRTFDPIPTLQQLQLAL